eukprot:8398600-Pyramimonas_sp.AAC.1
MGCGKGAPPRAIHTQPRKSTLKGISTGKPPQVARLQPFEGALRQTRNTRQRQPQRRNDRQKT